MQSNARGEPIEHQPSKDDSEKNGIQRFLRIVEQLKNFSVVTFDWHDIVRSDFLRDYIMTKEMLGMR